MIDRPLLLPCRPGPAWPAGAHGRATELSGGRTVRSWHLGNLDGSPVVIVHGQGAASDVPAPLAATLARRFRVHLVDLPGYGRSASPHAPQGPEQLADALAEWRLSADIPTASFIGNSAGCQVLVHLARRHPEHVHRLVLQGPTVDRQARTVRSQLLRLALDALLEHPTLWAVQVLGIRRTGVRRLLQDLRGFLDDAPERYIAEVRCPVLVVRGQLDPLVPARWAREVATTAPHGQVRNMPFGSHGLVYSRPRALAAAITAFLAAAELEPASPTTRDRHPVIPGL